MLEKADTVVSTDAEVGGYCSGTEVEVDSAMDAGGY